MQAKLISCLSPDRSSGNRIFRIAGRLVIIDRPNAFPAICAIVHLDMCVNGLFDQIMALKFVKENIEAFGGGPDNITVFVQFADRACILALMTMKEAEGLFHKAIVQSACIRMCKKAAFLLIFFRAWNKIKS